MDHVGQLQGAEDDADQERQHQQRWREETKRGPAGMTAHEFAAPHTGGEELTGQLAPVFAGPVGDLELRVEPDQMACTADAQVEFPVLAAPQRRVVAPDLVQDLAPEYAQVGGLGGSLLATAVVAGAAEPEPAVVGAGDRHLEWRLAVRHHDAAHVRGARSGQRLDRARGVAGREFGMRVDTHDDRMLGRCDREVEAHRDVGARVVHEPHPGIRLGQLLDQLGGAVARRPQRQHQVLAARILLGEYRAHRVFDVGPLVQYRHHV